jgi:glutamate 5-kinase
MPPASAGRPRRVVVKLGTGVLTSGIGQLDTARISAIARDLADLRSAGTEVIVVSSGAVGLGMGALGLARRPREVSRKQACAAIGQSRLMQTWQAAFAPAGLTVAQVLLTHEDLRARDRYLGVRACIRELVDYGTIPIINENDTVSAAEIKFGDNDTLSALVASLLEASHLVILSTAPGLIDLKGTGEIVPVVEKITPEIEAMAGGTTSETAVGGMVSKISAAKLATRAGCGVFIEARKRWLAYFQRPTGTITVNGPAVPVLRDEGRSLLAVGVTGVSGHFKSGDIVNVAGPDGVVFARGKTPYGSDEVAALAGLRSEDVRQRHPSRQRHEVVHRNDLVLL